MGTLSRSLENNYAAGPWRRLSVPDRPPLWDLLLESLKLTETDVRRLMKRRSKMADKLKRWIEAHHRDRFVPPRFLTVEQSDRCRWD